MKTKITLLFFFLLVSLLAVAQYQPPAPLPTPDYFGVANYANSPLPAGSIVSITVTDGGLGYTNPTVTVMDPRGTLAAATATVGVDGDITSISVTNGGSGYIAPMVVITDPTGTGATASAAIGGTLAGGIPKFVDNLPGFCGVTPPTSTLHVCIPVAQPDPSNPYGTGTDFYNIGLRDYMQQMHTNLPATRLRGYVQLDSNGAPVGTQSYLGPFIVAGKDRPVRVRFTNQLCANGGACPDIAPGVPGSANLPIPVDTTYMGAGQDANGNWYPQNRANLHLHGGTTPWISDGTPHQWITPAGDGASTKLKGDSFKNVPDMIGLGAAQVPDLDNDGQATYFWTNHQSGRLLFYHDHSYGITRLNVYAGEAAGYLIVDKDQENALAAGTAPGTIPNVTGNGAPDLSTADVSHIVPLVIQDKTFVPAADQLQAEDPTWGGINSQTSLYDPTANGLGNTGDLWFPHVYVPNQNPYDESGANAYGRWDYGPWFWPPQTSLTGAGGALTVACTSAAYPAQTLQCPITPNPSGTPEGFMDTPVINGTAYPVLHVAPAAYRFQILNAANDRSWNLGLYQAFDPNGNTVGTGTEVKMIPAVAGGAYPTCSTITRISDPAMGIGMALAGLDAQGNPINKTGLPANCLPTTWPTDGRDGGVPDPTTAGPPIIQIGSESGLLPAPVAIPSTPVNFEYGRRSITVLNVSTHGLWLGPAERADAIIDFSQFPGKTLIVYNDAPAPAPAFDTRYDYYTGNPDQVEMGGTPSTLPGYGPNTRTIMQIVVDAVNPNTVPFSLNSLKTAVRTNGATAGAYANAQHPPIVPESSLNSAYNAAYTNHYSRIQDTYLSYFDGGALPGIALTAGGTGYSSPTINIAGGGGSGATAVATVGNGIITAITLTSGGTGYTSAPTITISDATGTGATAVAGLPLLRKAIQELFTLDYGRMNATLGTELPLTSFNTQTTIPLGYVDPPTEILKPGDTQAWKITHNGVDTHFIHFHLFDVQVINRVGWDGAIKPPDPNEIGWKDTVRMNPLEDIVVAIRPVTPPTPFPVPDSERMFDVTMGLGPSPMFTNIDPFTNNPMTVLNQEVNLGWEYVWHCHILGHEENDMMRPIVYQVPPEAPSSLAVGASQTSGLDLTWTDNSASESNFEMQRADDAGFTTNVVPFVVGSSAPKTAYGSTITGNDPTVVVGGNYYYRVQAVDGNVFNGYTATGPVTTTLTSPWVTIGPVLAAPNAHLDPTVLNFAAIGIGSTSAPLTTTLTNTGNMTLSVGAIGISGANGGDFAQTNNCPATLAVNASCTFNVTYSPTGIGARYGTLTVASNDPTTPVAQVALRSPGYIPTAGIAPSSLTFANVPVGSTSAPQTITLSSTSQWPVQIGSISVMGTYGPQFAQTNNCGSAIPGSGSCTISVTFTPNSGITRAASISIHTDAGNFAVNLSGTGVAATGTLAPATVPFGNVQVNTTATQPVVLTNTGTVPLPIASITVAGASASWFGQTNDCPATLPAGNFCTINATFTPPFALTRSASLVVTGGAGTLSSALTGTGVAPAGSIDITNMAFGSVQVGQTSATQTVTLTNTGSGPLGITSVTLGGTYATQYTLSTTCAGSLSIGSSCTATVAFKPTSAGARNASLSFRTAAGNFAVTLTGTGVAPTATLTPATMPFGTQRVNTTSAPQTATLTNTGIGPLTISSVNIVGSGASYYGYTNNCPATLNAGNSCTITVTFTPLAAVTRNASLSVGTSAGTKNVTLSGTGN